MGKYIKKRAPTYSKDDINNALQKVENGMSIYKAAQEYKLPYETLRRWVVNPPTRVGSGKPSTLSLEEEQLIVRSLQFTAQCGHPLTRNDLASLVQEYVKSTGTRNPFKDGKPGKDWLHDFEARWSNELRKRKPQLLTKARAEGLTREILDGFFNIYENLLNENNLKDKPVSIYNLDEIGFATDPTGKKVFVEKKRRDAYLESACGGKSMYTVMFCGSASGKFLPPFVVYKACHLYDSWTKNGPEGTCYAVTKSGWMEDSVFENWITHFVKYTANEEKPILLVYDGHGSHLTYNTIKSAIDNKIIILCLPPNTSHALQPLDVGVFSPLKSVWRDILTKWYRETQLKKVEKAAFPSLLRQLFDICLKKKQNLVNGFKGCGLHPVNREAVEHKILVNVLNRPNSASSDEPTPEPSTSTSSENPPVGSPFKKLRAAILCAISPPPSYNTLQALENCKRKRKRVQAKNGEVLTSEDVAQRLLSEQEEREKKNASTNKTKKLTHLNREAEVQKEASQQKLDIQLGNWVCVMYSTKKSKKEFYGQVVDFYDEETCKVKFLRKSALGNMYSFPEKDDTDFISYSQIIQKLEEPTLNNRGQYKFI